MKKYAILDVGTNSIKFFIFSLDNNQYTATVYTNNISRLGEGLLKSGLISNKAIDRNIKVIKDFLEIAKGHAVDDIYAVGTMCLRTAKNSDEFLQRVQAELDLEIEVISGKKEASLSYLAVFTTMRNVLDENTVVFNTGGGSTEFLWGKGNELEKSISLNLGAVQLTEKFSLSDPITDSQLEAMQNDIEQQLQANLQHKGFKRLVGIGGAVTSMGAVKHKLKNYDRSIIHNSELNLKDVGAQIKLYKNRTIQERKKIIGLQEKRADVILAGTLMVKSIMQLFHIDKIIISDSGISYGVLFNRIIRKQEI